VRHHRAELERSTARTTGAELDAATIAAGMAHTTGAELDAATMASVLERATGPSWRYPMRAPRPELALSDARLQWAELALRLSLLGHADTLLRRTGVALTRSISLD